MNDELTRTLARAAAHSARAASLPFLRTEAAALTLARADFGQSTAPFRGGFNTALAREVIADVFAG